MTEEQWKDFCQRLVTNLEQQAKGLERHDPTHVGVLQIKAAADQWRNALQPVAGWPKNTSIDPDERGKNERATAMLDAVKLKKGPQPGDGP